MTIALEGNLIPVANLIGLVGGFLGLLMAVYLQWVRRKPCPARYPLGFWMTGSALILINYQALPIGVLEGTTILPIIGNLALVALEVWVFRLALEDDTCESAEAVETPDPPV